MWVFSGEKNKLHCFAGFGNGEVVRITETDSGYIKINWFQDRLGGKKQQNNIKHQLKLFKRFTGLKSMFIIFCLIFYMLGMCVYFFFQVAVTFTWRCGVVMTPTHTKRIQTSFIRSMRCTCAKNDIVCTAKCRCINYGNGKLSLQSVKRRKQGPPLLTTSLSS